MTKRISYTKVDESGRRQSRETFWTANGEELWVSLIPAKNTFTIHTDRITLAEGSGVSYQMLLKNAKKTLQGLGVQLTTETRNRGESDVSGGQFNTEAADNTLGVNRV